MFDVHSRLDLLKNALVKEVATAIDGVRDKVFWFLDVMFGLLGILVDDNATKLGRYFLWNFDTED